MSFSYKTLNSNDITLTSYIANKQWGANSSNFSQNGISVYVGENSPITSTNPFNPTINPETTNDEYRRLIFTSIKNLYYQNYISGSLTGQFFNSSSYFNYEQSTLTSGSSPLASYKNISLLEDSGFGGRYSTPTTLYDNAIYAENSKGKILILAVDQKTFGSGLVPNTISISGSQYNIIDDGEGNLVDIFATPLVYVGNVFYSQGLIVITNQEYICAFDTPPITYNEFFISLNTDIVNTTFDAIGNDFSDCDSINTSSFSSSAFPGYTFPDFTQDKGVLTLTPNQKSVIPGDYKLNYNILSGGGLRSNSSSINLTITYKPLEISNIISSSTCFGTSSMRPVTFSINYGVPYYSYSFDGTNYTSSNALTFTTVSGSMLSSTSSTVYVKDYYGTIISASFNNWYPKPTALTYILPTSVLCDSTGTTTIRIESGLTAVSASVNGEPYKKLPHNFTNATTSSTISYQDIYGCIATSSFNLTPILPVTTSISSSIIQCWGTPTGISTFSYTNLVGSQNYKFYASDVSYTIPLFTGSLDFPTNGSSSITLGGLNATASYTMSIFPSSSNTCSIQNFSTTHSLTQLLPISLSLQAIYASTCSNAISFSIAGGTPPYSVEVVNTGSGASIFPLSSPLLLNDNSGSTYTFKITDDNGCFLNSTNASDTNQSVAITVFGRKYILSGSTCQTT